MEKNKNKKSDHGVTYRAPMELKMQDKVTENVDRSQTKFFYEKFYNSVLKTVDRSRTYNIL